MSPPANSLAVRNWIIGIVVVLAVAAAALFWMMSGDAGGDGPSGADSPQTEAVSTKPPETVAPADQPPLEGRAGGDTVDPSVARWTDLMGAPPAWPTDWTAAPDCDAVEQKLERVCGTVDLRPGGRALAALGGSCGLLREAAEELARRPPRVGSELRSYETMLANVFHLFRVLGRERMQAAVKTLRAENELEEPFAMAAYRWAASREACDDRSALDGEVLYDYAAFLFQTMGGQAYLRRRAPRTEALTCFYALDALDRSMRSKHNPHGIDPRPEIERCRALISTSASLVFRDHYLERLDLLSERWKAEPR